ncbi:MAG: cryptochrome/photolyase family protein [Thioalkalivibrionaceae bacterium]
MHDTAIVWLRRDLRLDDNPALAAACANARKTLIVYIHAPEELAPWAPGAASNWWLHHSLAALIRAIADRGGELHCFKGDSAATLTALIEATGASLVTWNRTYEPQAIERDRSIKQVLRERGIEVRSFNAALLVEPWSLQTQNGDPYKVFSPFWRAAKRQGFDERLCDAPKQLHPAMLGEKAPQPLHLDDLALLPDRDWADDWLNHWQPGEDGAYARLMAFVKGSSRNSQSSTKDLPIVRYATARERPDQPGTSRLSPHLHFGEIGPRQIVNVLRENDLNLAEEAEAFFRELGWREFAHHVLYHFPHTPDEPLNPRFKDFDWRADPDNKLLQAWQRGCTGIPIVDAAMRELWTTGWMHNRARMVVGSFLTKNLRLPWQTGARWFWDTLVDADLAANTLGWQWAGGSGADAAPYFRIFNPLLQSEKFDPDNAYITQHLPELKAAPVKYRHDPAHLSKHLEPRHYPRPVVDLKTSRNEALMAFEALKKESA